MAYPTHGAEYHERAPWKQSCRAATTANITISTALNAGDTLDGVTLAAGDRVLVKNQGTGSQNGIYVVSASPARAPDFDAGGDALAAVVAVTEGTANADTIWFCTTNGPITLGTTALTFVSLDNTAAAAITAHLADTSDAHDASAISFVPAGTIAATNVQAAIEEVAGEAGGGGGSGGWVPVSTNGTQLEPGRIFLSDQNDLAYILMDGEIDIQSDSAGVHIWSDGDAIYLRPDSAYTVRIMSGNGLVLPGLTSDPTAIGDGQQLYRSDTDELRVRANGAWTSAELRRGSGTATVTSGNTSVTVTHGAGYTPNVADVMVTPTNSPTNDPGHWWVSAVGATTFVINVRANPGASGASFAWRVAH